MNPALDGGLAERLSPELQALIMGIRGEAPTSTGVDWERLKALAMIHGIAPLLHRAWRDLPNIIPPEILDDFKYVRQQSALIGAFGFRQRDAVVNILNQANIPCLVLKGAALAKVWYGDLSLRPFIDIDLLLPAGEVSRAQQLLVRAGYRDGPDWEASHHERPLYCTGMPCVVELHHELTRLTQLRPLRFEDLCGRAIVVDGTGGRVRTLGPEDTLLHLCLHLLAHLEQDHGWRFRYIVDIAYHLEAFEIDWSAFNERAEAGDAGRGCAAVLGLTRLVMGNPIPDSELDLQIVLRLLHHPVPGEIDHRLLAAFLGALYRVDVRLAVAILRRPTVSGRGKDRFRFENARPHRLLPIVRRLLHEAVTHPLQLRTQLRIWLPNASKWGDRERLLSELLAPSRSHGP